MKISFYCVDSDSKGRGFESLRADHKKSPINPVFMRVCRWFCFFRKRALCPKKTEKIYKKSNACKSDASRHYAKKTEEPNTALSFFDGWSLKWVTGFFHVFFDQSVNVPLQRFSVFRRKCSYCFFPPFFDLQPDAVIISFGVFIFRLCCRFRLDPWHKSHLFYTIPHLCIRVHVHIQQTCTRMFVSINNWNTCTCMLYYTRSKGEGNRKGGGCQWHVKSLRNSLL